MTLAPNAVLVSPALGAQASSTIAVSQSGYTGGYTASVSGCVGVGTPPTATVVSTGPGMANVVVTATGTVNLNLGCQVTVTGGNGMTAIAPVTVTLAAGGTPTPSPSPTASSAASPGPVVVNPTSILLSPAVGSAATTTVTATQVNGGPFTATVTSCVGAGTPPVAAVTNTGNGMATVTVTASGVVGAQIGCNLVITGAGMQSTTVPLTVSAVVIGPSPTPVPSPTGTGLGTLRVNPTSVLLQPSALGANASANILVGQANYTGSFGATLRCPVALNQPMVSVSGTGVAGQGVVTVTVGGPVNAAVACNVIITGGGGQSVSVPVTVAATVGVGATPTPNPNGTGPLTANPATILLNPGVATTATQNVVLSDPGYAGPYGATVTCATSGLTPILAAAFVTPTVTVTGDVVTVMSPAQPLGLSVLCTVTASSNIGQSVAIPVTVSVGVLSALDRHRRLAASSSVLFTPATVSLSAAGSAAVGSFAVSGAPGPYRVTSACLGGLGLRAIVLGNRVELEERGATALGGTCLLTVTASTGATGQIPVRTSAGAGIPTLLTSEPAHRISLARTSLTLRAGEMQSIAASGSGPFTIAGCAAVVDVRSSAGALLITGRSPGVCSLTVRGSGGGSAIVTVTVVPGVSLPARMQPRR